MVGWCVRHVLLLILIMIGLTVSSYFVSPVLKHWDQVSTALAPQSGKLSVDATAVEALEELKSEQGSALENVQRQLKAKEVLLDDLAFWEVESKLETELDIAKLEKEEQLHQAAITHLDLMIAYADADRCQQQCEALTKRCIAAIRTEGQYCPIPFQCTTLVKHLPPWREICPPRKAECDAAAQMQENICNKKNRVCKACKSAENPGAEIELKIQSTGGPLIQGLNAAWRFVEEEVLDQVWRALSVVLLIVLSPWLINAIVFFVIAPLGVRLFKERLGRNDGLVTPEVALISSVNLTLELSDGQVALIKPDVVKALPANAKTRTRWFLNRKTVLTSLSAGLTGLTEIDGDGLLQVGAPENTQHTKLIALKVPANEEFVLKPSHIVGVIYDHEKPLRIRKLWRLNSLSAWLTFRLRHLVFSGEVTLLLTGNHGIDALPVDSASPITVSDFIGYSANLEHRVQRTETFYAFHTNQQELFKHSFAQSSGIVLQETQSSHTTVSRAGWSLRRLVDFFLNLFGI